MTSCEVKMLDLAKGDATLQSFLADDVVSQGIRWFDRNMPQGCITRGTCVRVLRVSTESAYAMTGALGTEKIRFQIDVLDLDPERARQAAFAISQWFGRVDFMSNAQFTSPPTTPRQFPNFQQNQRAGMDYQIRPPAYVETLDVRVYNNQNF